MAKAKPKPTKPTVKLNQRFGGWEFGEITTEEGLTKATFNILLAPGQNAPTSTEAQQALGAQFFRIDGEATARRAEQLLVEARISPTVDSLERREKLCAKAANKYGSGSTHHLAALVLCASAELREFRERLEQEAQNGPVDPAGIGWALGLSEQLGAARRELEWKLDHEKHAQQGKGSERGRHEGRTKGTEQSAIERGHEATQIHAEWRKRARDMRRRNPKLSNSKIAKKIAEDFPHSFNYIRQKLAD